MATSPTPPKPLFCLVRPGLERFTAVGELIVQPGTIVPLIPMDLLPEWLEIVGVPRQLSPEQVSGMTSVGSFHPETDTYRVKFHIPNEDTDSKGIAGDSTDGSTIESTEPSQRFVPTRVDNVSKKSATNPFGERGQGLASSLHNPLNENAYSHRSASPAEESMKKSPIGESSNSPQNAYCRKWCLNGICKWGVLCRYKHSMPNTLEDLASVGLKNYPQWWLTALGVLTVMPTIAADAGTVTAGKKPSSKKRSHRKATGSSDKPRFAKKDKKANACKAARPEQDQEDTMEDTDDKRVFDEDEDLIEI